MAQLSKRTEPIGNEELDTWEEIGDGGFGKVYKARHKGWGHDVAIKLIHNVAGSPSSLLSGPSLSLLKDKALHDEAAHMDTACSEFVLRVFGFYQGVPPPTGGDQEQKGIIMELMKRGTVQTLQKKLSDSPPRPLAFRLAHQVALGMNFLHKKNIVHQDLKPSNVLLDKDLNAKLADFGLARVSTSVLNVNDKTAVMIGGSYKYMPPEAFKTSYQPVRAFDIYSYGIFLWSVLSGSEPYPDKGYSLVAHCIPKGDRPSCDEMNKAEELREMVELMKRCWDKEPKVRPTFLDCLNTTEKLLSKHERGIPDAVCDILKRLDSQPSDEHPQTTVPPVPESDRHDTVDLPAVTAPQSLADVPTKIRTVEEKAKFVMDNYAVLIQKVSKVIEIAEELGDMVYDEVRSGIQAEKMNENKMRLFYSKIITPAGERIKAAFYDALKNHHPRLVEELGGKP